MQLELRAFLSPLPDWGEESPCKKSSWCPVHVREFWME